jgi:hypothetical protein
MIQLNFDDVMFVSGAGCYKQTVNVFGNDINISIGSCEMK